MKPFDKRSRPAVIGICVSLCLLYYTWLWNWARPGPIYGERIAGRVQQLTYDYDYARWLAHIDAHAYDVPAAVLRYDRDGPVVVYVAPAGAPVIPLHP